MFSNFLLEILESFYDVLFRIFIDNASKENLLILEYMSYLFRIQFKLIFFNSYMYIQLKYDYKKNEGKTNHHAKFEIDKKFKLVVSDILTENI